MFDAMRLLEGMMSSGLGAGAQRMAAQPQGGGLGDLLGGMMGGAMGGGGMGRGQPQGGGMPEMLLGMLGNMAMQKMAGSGGHQGGGMPDMFPSHQGGGRPDMFPSRQGDGRPDMFSGHPGHGHSPAPSMGGMAPPRPPRASHDRALLLVRAMIAAAKADGHIDREEQQAILGKLEESGMDHHARSFVMEEMRRPLDVESLVQEVRDLPQAIEVYTFSLMAITLDSHEEADYLRHLAQRLNLDPSLVNGLHEQLGAPTIFM